MEIVVSSTFDERRNFLWCHLNHYKSVETFKVIMMSSCMLFESTVFHMDWWACSETGKLFPASKAKIYSLSCFSNIERSFTLHRLTEMDRDFYSGCTLRFYRSMYRSYQIMLRRGDSDLKHHIVARYIDQSNNLSLVSLNEYVPSSEWEAFSRSTFVKVKI